MGTVVTGTVKGGVDAALVYAATLTVEGADGAEGAKGAKRAARLDFELVTPDGEAVSVAVGPAVELLPIDKRTDTWGDLQSHPLARAFTDEAPGDHVKVTLEGTAIRAGDRVAIWGNEEKRLEPDGYRGAGSVARSFTARAIAVGPDAEEALVKWKRSETAAAEAPKPKSKPKPRSKPTSARSSDPSVVREHPLPVSHARAIAIGGAGLAVVGLALWLTELGPRFLRPELMAIGAALVSAGLFIWRRRHFLPWFQAAGQKSKERGDLPWRAGAWAATYLGVLGLVVAVSLAQLVTGDASGGVIVMLVAALGPLAFAGGLFVSQRESARLVRLVSSTPLGAAGNDGTRALEITVESGELRRKLRGHSASGTTTESYTDEQGHVHQREVTRRFWEWTVSNDAADFEIVGHTAEGKRVRVRPSGAVFATMVRDIEQSKSTVKMTEAIVPETKLLVVGRFTEDGDALVAKSTGRESLVLFGARDGARAAARRASVTHLVTLGALVALGACLVAIGWHNPFQTHHTLTGHVIEARGPIALDEGDGCTLEIAHHEAGLGDRCQAALSCGGEHLYGGLNAGWFDCTAAEDGWSGGDYDPSDGDEALQFVSPHSVEAWAEDGRRVVIALDAR